MAPRPRAPRLPAATPALALAAAALAAAVAQPSPARACSCGAFVELLYPAAAEASLETPLVVAFDAPPQSVTELVELRGPQGAAVELKLVLGPPVEICNPRVAFLTPREPLEVGASYQVWLAPDASWPQMPVALDHTFVATDTPGPALASDFAPALSYTVTTTAATRGSSCESFGSRHRAHVTLEVTDARAADAPAVVTVRSRMSAAPDAPTSARSVYWPGHLRWTGELPLGERTCLTLLVHDLYGALVRESEVCDWPDAGDDGCASGPRPALPAMALLMLLMVWAGGRRRRAAAATPAATGARCGQGAPRRP